MYMNIKVRRCYDGDSHDFALPLSTGTGLVLFLTLFLFVKWTTCGRCNIKPVVDAR